MTISRKAIASMMLALLVTAGAFGVTMVVTEPPPSVRPSNVYQLTHDAAEHIEPTYSPDGKYIAFSSNLSGSYDVWIMREDGRKQTRMTWLPGDELTPKWNPNGGNIAFVWSHGSHSDLCTTSMNEGGSECLTDGMHVDTYSWSPDGLVVAYSAGDGTIRFHNMTNGSDTPFRFDANVGDPAFGPDPTTLYFSVRTDNGDYIWGANVNGSGARQLSWMGSDVEPQVSPSGNRLMYLTNLTGRYEPWLVDLDTGINTYIFNRPDLQPAYTFPDSPLLASGTVPCWGPNGTRILLISSANGTQGSLYLVTLDFPVDLLAQSPSLRGFLPPNEIFYLNVYNKVSVGDFTRDSQWSPSGNVVIEEAVSGFQQLFLLRSGPPVNVGYGG